MEDDGKVYACSIDGVCGIVEDDGDNELEKNSDVRC